MPLISCRIKVMPIYGILQQKWADNLGHAPKWPFQKLAVAEIIALMCSLVLSVSGLGAQDLF